MTRAFLDWVLTDDIQREVFTETGNMPAWLDIATDAFAGGEKLLSTVVALESAQTPDTNNFFSLSINPDFIAGRPCAMVSLHSLGLVGLRWLRDRSPLPIHGHRNGWGLLSRSPDIGIAFPAMQKLWRLAGVDHLHVNGLANKFTEPDATVIESARALQAPLGEGTQMMALPVFSSGQTAWQVGPTAAALGNEDFLFCAGGGIMGHPDGPGAGVAALRLAAEAHRQGIDPLVFAQQHPALAKALTRGWQPCIYVTTETFLIAFGLVCLQDLPDPEQMADAGLSVSAHAFDLGDLFGEHCFWRCERRCCCPEILTLPLYRNLIGLRSFHG